MKKPMTVFVLTIMYNAFALFWKMDIKLVTPNKFMCTLKEAAPDSSFPGFSLCFFDLTDGYYYYGE